jgi:hypothetical protein
VATPSSTPTGGSGDGSPALAWVVPVLAFLAGCLLSGIAVAVITSGPDEDASATAPPSAVPASPGTAAVPSPELVVRVPQSCLDAADGAIVAAGEAEQVVEAVRELDARRLQEIVDRFQRTQPGLQEAARRCRETTDERIQDGLLDTPAPTPAPSATG